MGSSLCDIWFSPSAARWSSATGNESRRVSGWPSQLLVGTGQQSLVSLQVHLKIPYMYIITTIWPHDTAAFSIWDLATSSQGISPAALTDQGGLSAPNDAFSRRPTGEPDNLAPPASSVAGIENSGSPLRNPRGFSSFFLLNETVTVCYSAV